MVEDVEKEDGGAVGAMLSGWTAANCCHVGWEGRWPPVAIMSSISVLPL